MGTYPLATARCETIGSRQSTPVFPDRTRTGRKFVQLALIRLVAEDLMPNGPFSVSLLSRHHPYRFVEMI